MKLNDQQRAILKDYMNLIEEGARSGAIDMAFYHALESFGKKKVLEEYRLNPDRQKREYISKAFVDTAYRYILDCGGSVNDAIEYSFAIYDQSREWWDRLKNKEFFDSKEIMSDNKDHPKQKLMLTEGTMDKVVMNQSRSANQFLRRAAKSVGLSNTLAELKDEVDTVKVENIVQQFDIDDLYNKMGIPRTDKKRIARILFDKGYTKKVIMDVLGISMSTVKRYLRKIEYT